MPDDEESTWPFSSLTLDQECDDIRFDAAAETNDHEYDGLDPETSQVRLIEILPKDGDEQLRCRTRIYDLDRQVRFVALSYTWGSPPAQHAIMLDGKKFHVRKNLWRFLTHVRKHNAFSKELFWIDAICIDQKNLGERTRQVKLMPQIYEGAFKVLIWLGPAYDSSDTAMNFLIRFGSSLTKESKISKIWTTPIGKAISELCERAYWERLWVFQEIVFAKDINMMCGDLIIRWKIFRDLLLNTYLAKLSTRITERSAYKNVIKSSATNIVAQTARKVEERSLWSLIIATRKLKCSDVRDKVYGLLGIAKSRRLDITADYSLPVLILLNYVLQERYATQQPKDIDEALDQCRDLSNAIGIDHEMIFKLHPNYRSRHSFPSDSEVAFFSSVLRDKTDMLLWAYFYEHRAVLKLICEDFSSRNLIRKTLCETARAGCSNATRILLTIDADAKILDISREEACIIAAEYGHSEVLELLLHAEINVDRTDRLGRTALHAAASNGHSTIVELLLHKTRVKINAQDLYGRTALHTAVEKGRSEVLKPLIRTTGFNVNARDQYGRTALHVAADTGRCEVLKVLLHTARFNVNELDRYGRTALHIAANRGHSEVLELLTHKTGIDVDAQDLYGRTALHTAAENGHSRILELLVHVKKANVNTQDRDGRTALHAAALGGHAAAVNTLLSCESINANILNNSKESPLHYAASLGYTAVMTALLKSDAIDPNVCDTEGFTALHSAARQGHVTIAVGLLNLTTIDVNIQSTEHGLTALHLAIIGGYTAIATALIADRRVDTYIEDSEQRLAFDYATVEGCTSAIGLLYANRYEQREGF